MSYAIMRLEKRKAININGMEIHNERKTDNHTNQEIDVSKKNENYHLIKCENLKKSIDKELKERYTYPKSIRKDAVVCTEFIFTSDKSFFEKLNQEEEKIFFEKSVEFLKEQFGEKNVLSAIVHKDEETPHLHAVIIPLNDKGNLSMKSYLDGKKDLANFQDNYYEKISKNFPQLERGKSSNITKNKHLEIDDLKKKTNYKDKKIEEIKNTIESKNHYQKNLETIKIIEEKGMANKSLLGKKVSIPLKEFETLVSHSKNYINQETKIKELTENFKKISIEKNKLNSECSTLFKSNETLKIKLNKQKEFERYILLLEKELININSESLGKVQDEFLKDKWLAEKEAFYKEKISTNTLASSNGKDKILDKSRGWER